MNKSLKVIGLAEVMLAVLKREIALGMRQKGEVLTPLVFFMVVTSLFPLGVGAESNLLLRMAPGVLWVSALLAAMLSLQRMFATDYADGSLEQMVLSPTPLGLLVLWLGYGALPHNATARPQGIGLSWPDVLMNMLMFGLVFLGADMLGRRVGAVPTAGGLATGLALLVAGIAVGVVYLRRQWHLPVPLFPVDLLRIPVFRLSMCTSVGAFAAQMLAYVGLPFFLLDGLGRTPVEAGLLITAWPLGTVVAAPLAGRLIGRYPDGLLGGIGLGLFASGLGLLALLPAHPTGADIVWRMALCGMGFGLFQSPNNHTIVTSAPVHRSGGASGMLGTARLTGQTTGAVILAMIFSVADAHDGRGPTIALGLAALFACVAAGFSLRRLRHGVPGKYE